MKRFLISTAAVATMFAAVVPAAQAATAAGFDVTVTLTSKCELTTVGAPTIAFGPYTAFTNAAIGPVALSPAITFHCTRNLPAPTVTATPFDAVNGSAAGLGVIAGLAYSLTAPVISSPSNGVNATTTVGAVADDYSVTFSGSMAGGQAGQCGAASCAATLPRTVTISF